MDELSQIKRLISDLENKIQRLEKENSSWFLWKIEQLENIIEKLEKENFALKQAIISACDSLVQGNDAMNNTLVSSQKEAVYQPSFKQPKWKIK